MSKSTLKAKVNQLAATCEPYGFLLDGPFRLKRCLANLDQFIEIQPGHEWLEGKFTCNLCWKHTADGVAADDVYDHVVNLGYLIGSSELWLSHKTKDDLAASYSHVENLLKETCIPFLDRLSDLRRMIEMYEEIEDASTPIEAPTDARSFFGVDEGWMHYNLGFAYKMLGNQDKATAHLSLVIERHSDQPFDWVRNRQQKCKEALVST